MPSYADEILTYTTNQLVPKNKKARCGKSKIVLKHTYINKMFSKFSIFCVLLVLKMAAANLESLKNSDNLKSEVKKLLVKDIKYKDDEIVGITMSIENGMKNFLRAEVEVKTKDGKTEKRKIFLNLSGKDEFPNEAYSYETVLAALNDYQNEKKFSNAMKIPKFYGKFNIDDNDVAVLDGDNDQWVFKNINTEHKLQNNEMKVIVDEYAKLHALSLGLQKDKADTYNSIKSKLYQDFDKFIEKFDAEKNFDGLLNDVYKVLLNGAEGDPSQEFYKVLFKKLGDSLRPMSQNTFEDLKTFVHGDFWANQFQYYSKENEGQIVGWRRPYESSPIFDISYFVFTAIGMDDLEKAQEYLLQYHTSFSKFAEELKLDKSAYTLQIILELWKKYNRLGLLQAVLVTEQCQEDASTPKSSTENPLDKPCFKEKADRLAKYAISSDILAVEFSIEEIEKFTGVTLPKE